MAKNSARDELARFDAERAAEAQQEQAAQAAVRQKCGSDPEAIQARINAIETERQSLLELRRPIDERLAVLYRDTAAAKDVLGEVRLAQKSGKPDWAFMLDIGNDGQVMHQAWEKAVQTLGLWSDGYNPESNQRQAQVVLTKGDQESLQRTLDGIKTLLPHLKPDAEGWVHFGILDHTLSANGSYRLGVMPDLSAASVGRAHGFSPQEFKSLDRALAHVQEVHWYDEAEMPVAPKRR